MSQWASGKDGKATFASTDINITRWSYEEAGDDADVTHSGSDGVKLSLVVNKQYTGTFEGNWDLDSQPTTNPPQLNRGDTGSLSLYVSREASIDFTTVEVTGLTIDSEVNGLVTFTVSWQGQVNPTYPGATALSSSSSSSSSSVSSTSSSSSSSSST